MSETKERIVNASAELFRRRGYTGTGVKQIVAEAGAPFGSIYHFFPGGKEQLGAATIRHSGALYARLLPAVFDAAPDLVSGVRNFYELAAEHLAESDYADACPIATVALEVSSTNEVLREACAEVFEGWIVAGTERFAAAGLSEPAARRFTIGLITALEGAFILCRATRDTEALHVAGAHMAAAATALLTPAE